MSRGRLTRIKKLIRDLPGPKSYCKCKVLCSPLEVEHVMPNALLKKGQHFGASTADPHNLYMCCRKINEEKGAQLFAKDFILDSMNSFHNGALSRSCLYMHAKYELNVDKKIVSLWRHLHVAHAPYPFEFERDDLIHSHNQTRNPFLEDYNDLKQMYIEFICNEFEEQEYYDLFRDFYDDNCDNGNDGNDDGRYD